MDFSGLKLLETN